MSNVSITVESAEVEAKFARLIAIGKDQSKAMKSIGRELDQLIRNSFRTETSPWGTPWPDHSPVTTKDRERRGQASVQKLVDSGAMFDSIGYTSDANSATVTAGEGIDYVQAQQFGNPANKAWGRGSAPIPARPFFPLRSPNEAELPGAWLNAVLVPIEKIISEAIR